MTMREGEIKAELTDMLQKSLRSNTIEWAMNLRICDIISERPSLAATTVHYIGERLRSSTPVKVVLSLSLLEMLVKNCGLVACQAITADDAQAMVDLVKHREGWQYSVGRNLHKSLGSLMPQVGIGDQDRQLWLQAAQKTLDLLQLWTDAFMLQQGNLQPIFAAYKQLRQEGYKFKSRESGSSAADVVLVHGAEQSPVVLAGAGGASASDMETSPVAQQEPEEESQPERQAHGRSQSGAHSVEKRLAEIQQSIAELRSLSEGAEEMSGAVNASQKKSFLQAALRESQRWATNLLEQQMDLPTPSIAEAELEELCAVLEEIAQEGLLDQQEQAMAAELPPPPAEEAPSKEQQELYDMLLARMLQERFEREDAIGGSDAELARRLAGMDNMVGLGTGQEVGCFQCQAPNALADNRPGALFACYLCGQVQRIPDNAVRPQRTTELPRRQAPPPRVICASATSSEVQPELFINNGRDAVDDEDDIRPQRNHVTHLMTQDAVPSQSEESNQSDVLSGSAFRSARESLLGAPVDQSEEVTSVENIVRSWAPLQTKASKRLGDGVPRKLQNVSEEDEDADVPLTGDGPPASGSRSRSHGINLGNRPWRRSKPRKGPTEANSGEGQSLVERVQMDEEWELIRPSEGRPYWYNSRTQRSQWEPPSM